MMGREAQGSAECQGPAIDNHSIPICSEPGCFSSTRSSHWHCSQATDRQGTVIFSEVQTTAPQPGHPEVFTAPASPFLPSFVSIFP